jgi:white-opaque regulator 2
METVRRNKMEDLFSYGGVPPPQTPADTSVNLEEIKKLFVNDYAPGLDKLLETTWYSTKGLEHLLGNAQLCRTFEFLRQKFLLASGPSQYEAARQIPSLEAKVTWQLLCLCREVAPAPTVNGTNGTTSNGQAADEHQQLDEAKARLDVLEHLLTGEPVEANPLLHLEYPSIPETDPKHFQVDFWKNLGSYVSEPANPESSKANITAALAGMRNTLHQLENRDVIYSIAIVRHVGAKPEVASSLHNQQHQPWSNDPEDDHNKLFVAKRFLEDESQNGMTQVIARFAGMAVTGWGPIHR